VCISSFIGQACYQTAGSSKNEKKKKRDKLMLNNRTTVGLLMEDPGYVNIMVYYNYGEDWGGG